MILMKEILLIFFAALLLQSGCSTPSAIVAPKQKGEMQLSESPAEVSASRMVHHENTGFSYSFEYDKENLYLMLSTADQDLQRKIAYFGFTVWIDKNGGNNKEQGFRFPTGMNMEQFLRNAVPGNARNRADVMQKSLGEGTVKSALDRADEIDLIGIYGSSTRTVKMRDSRIRANSEVVNDELIYEAVVPFEMLQFGFDPLRHSASVSVGFETGSFESAPAERRQMTPDNDRRGGGMIPGRGGQMPGQAAGRMPEMAQREPSGAAFRELSKPTRLWIVLEFAP